MNSAVVVRPPPYPVVTVRPRIRDGLSLLTKRDVLYTAGWTMVLGGLGLYVSLSWPAIMRRRATVLSAIYGSILSTSYRALTFIAFIIF